MYELKAGPDQPCRLICPVQIVARSQFGNIVKIMVGDVDMVKWHKRKFQIFIDRVGSVVLSGDEILALSGKRSISKQITQNI